jgi:NAD(P)-dependent dehydrogenase (short-subunit alcohol dehydrogenase family)
MRLQLPRMLAAGGGSIVNCASVFALVGSRGGSAYAASKHGVIGLTRSAALENAAHRIRVNAVCPGLSATPMVDRLEAASPRFRERAMAATPGERLVAPEQVAATVLWLCGAGAAAVTGQAIAVDDGFTAG